MHAAAVSSAPPTSSAAAPVVSPTAYGDCTDVFCPPVICALLVIAKCSDAAASDPSMLPLLVNPDPGPPCPWGSVVERCHRDRRVIRNLWWSGRAGPELCLEFPRTDWDDIDWPDDEWIDIGFSEDGSFSEWAYAPGVCSGMKFLPATW
jgi:hypothetical protein